MPTVLITFLMALGGGAWIYNKVHRSTGNDTKTALLVAGGCAMLIAIIVFMLLGLVPS